jgi:hypothetical protein
MGIGVVPGALIGKHRHGPEDRPDERRRSADWGLAVSFNLLARALTKCGWLVYANDRGLARRNPEYPVGPVSFPTILEGWDLPNPALLGPSLFDHPLLAPHLMEDRRFRKRI